MVVPRAFTAADCAEWAGPQGSDMGKATLWCYLPRNPQGKRFKKASDESSQVLKNDCGW
jgi:hypothetical protein